MPLSVKFIFFVFFFNDTATTEIYTLSLHDALPISMLLALKGLLTKEGYHVETTASGERSEEHTSELQSLAYLVCRLLLEKKKKREPSHQVHRRRLLLRGCEQDASICGASIIPQEVD